jgi:outer membrane protein OmpA-like peptidoglycan-associated protein
MDRTVGHGPPVLTADDPSGAADPFKEKLERGGRKRAERRDPRIQPPQATLFAAASPAALDIVRGPLASQPGRADAFAMRNAPPEPIGPAVILEPIIPPGEVFVDPVLVGQGRESDAAFGPPPGRAGLDRSGRDKGPLAPGIAPALATSLPVQHVSSLTAPPASRTSIKAFAPGAPAVRDRKRKAAPTPSDDRQDDVATGAIAAVLLLLAGWMGLQVLGSPRAPVAPPDPVSGPLVDVASAPAPAAAPVAADPFAGAPLDLTPGSATVAGGGLVSTPATAALDIPMSPGAFAAFSVMSAAAIASAPVTEASPAAPVSCDPNMVIRSYFCTAQTGLTASSRALLERELAALRACSAGREIVVTGFADTRGLAVRNAALGEGRAETVAQLLRSQGLAVVTVAGVGEASGLEDGRNCANQRRVDISFRDGAPAPSLACAPPSAAAALTCG